MNQKELFPQGFQLGVNYWASHAGISMWHNWDEAAVEDDFRRLSEHNILLLRIFPLWSDFQPLKMLYGGGGSERELRMGNDEKLPFTPEGRAGVDPVMADRFERVLQLGEKYHIRFIVGLLTGWMSGRWFVPRIFETVNVVTDHRAINWEIRFVEYMVRRFKSSPAVAAWEFGNECNCLGHANREDAYHWAKSIATAVRAIDPDRPMLSGMHGLFPMNSWNPADQGEITDMLTTHPYPLFTPHCNTDPLISMKSAFHASAESMMYSDLGKKPCFVEEAGSLAPMMASAKNVALYLTVSAMTAWAYRLPAYLWWCANEQIDLEEAPYDWNAVERELGVFYADKTPKPICYAMSRLQQYTDDFPYRLTTPIREAVCILTREQDTWAAAYGCFMMAVQAGFGVRFCFIDQDTLPDADCYLMPSVTGGSAISRENLNLILDRVRKGATLYISMGEALISPFEQFAGLEPQYRMKQPRADEVRLPDGTVLHLNTPITMICEPTTTRVIASAPDGNPAISVNEYGEGRIWFVGYPVETMAATTPYGLEKQPLYEIYRLLGARSKERIVSLSAAQAAVTEHILDDGKHAAVLMNYAMIEQTLTLSVATGWTVADFLPLDPAASADGCSFKIPAHSGAVIILSK